MYQVVGAGMPVTGHAGRLPAGPAAAAGVNQTAVAAYAAAAAAAAAGQGYVSLAPSVSRLFSPSVIQKFALPSFRRMLSKYNMKH